MNFTYEELELLERCLSKYFYEIEGTPEIVISCYNKIQMKKEEAKRKKQSEVKIC
jgi:hypothetical protein